MKPMIIATCAAATMLSACANVGANYTPVLDGPRNASFQSDLKACQALARKQPQLTKRTMTAAVVGAGIGAAMGEADDNDPVGGAIAGAGAGGVAGTVNQNARREGIVTECMRGRGHPVVG